METENNKQVVKTFFTLLNEKKMNEAFELLSEDLHWWILGNIAVSGDYDKRKISLGLKMLHRSFDNFLFSFGDFTAEGNRVSIILESHAKRKSNGKSYNNHYHFLFTLKDGKIEKVKEFFDTVHAVWVEEA
ncbi:polyketide cyclase [Leptospira ognonensis]|uniref:Polyketide cyclase n=1 Tax=Leptospira ognonensis TaxID=2484945 RepID=A0A4R9JVC2_9LEPT|nr:nuclear transport factor 2 family protein [Leptospira ognonensis]TGL55869.1 polyketide cyclase [Leptospira ognonensis]